MIEEKYTAVSILMYNLNVNDIPTNCLVKKKPKISIVCNTQMIEVVIFQDQ